MSPALIAALQGWLDEATSAEPCRTVREHGLCRWMEEQSPALEREFCDLRWDTFAERPVYPFGGPDNYYHRQEFETQHRDPSRLAWVRDTLGVLA